MNWFPYCGITSGLSWVMVFMPLLFFGMMLFCWRTGRGSHFSGCCGMHRDTDLAAEVSGLRREIEEIKKNIV
ncbi:MAG: hypothetical protein H6Q76_2458 [Firmicutes bacterium]|nr:hypothetical protein [Bacillota bacterium]